MKTVKDIFMVALGVAIALGLFVLIGLLIAYRPEMTSVIDMSIGALVAAFSMVVGYYYGSSKGSADKNDIISRK
jgi:hypothetical protein